VFSCGYRRRFPESSLATLFNLIAGKEFWASIPKPRSLANCDFFDTPRNLKHSPFTTYQFPIHSTNSYFITMCHAYVRTIFPAYAHLVMRGRSPFRRSRGTLRAPSPQPAAHDHIPPNRKPAHGSRRAAFAMPAAGTSHVRKSPVSPLSLSPSPPSFFTRAAHSA
jgi:hypothetical protein